MTTIDINRLTKRFGPVLAVDDLSAGSDVEGLSLWSAAALLAAYCGAVASVAVGFTVRRDVS